MSSNNGRTKRWFKRIVLSLLGLLAVTVVASWLIEQMAEARDRRRFPPSGRLVQVGPTHLHAWFAGTNHSGPTVVFEAGLGATLDFWHYVAPAVAEFAPVVVYERPGVGWSETSFQPHDAVHISQQLQQLLREVGAKPPFVLVGHSMGGLYVLGHAMQFPEAVAGTVLVDSSHPDQTKRKQFDPARNELKPVRFLAATAPFGTARLVIGAGQFPLPEDDFIRARCVCPGNRDLVEYRAGYRDAAIQLGNQR